MVIYSGVQRCARHLQTQEPFTESKYFNLVFFELIQEVVDHEWQKEEDLRQARTYHISQKPKHGLDGVDVLALDHL